MEEIFEVNILKSETKTEIEQTQTRLQSDQGLQCLLSII